MIALNDLFIKKKFCLIGFISYYYELGFRYITINSNNVINLWMDKPLLNYCNGITWFYSSSDYRMSFTVGLLNEFSFFDLLPLCDIVCLKDLMIALLLKKDRD